MLICIQTISTCMKEYDLIIIGSGSAMNIVDPMIQENPNIRIAVIDKDEPGGICLTRGCIPSKILLYPAELVRKIEEARDLGIDTQVKKINFQFVMERMRKLIDHDIDQIREGLSNSKNIDYYHSAAEFVSPYTLKVSGTEIKSKMILLCIGSKTIIPPIKGLDKIRYHTSDSAFLMKELPESIAIVGGGYIAAELAKQVFGRHINIITNHEVKEVRETPSGIRELVALDRKTGRTMTIKAQEIMIASGRGPPTDILHPERSGIKTTPEGWKISVGGPRPLAIMISCALIVMVL